MIELDNLQAGYDGVPVLDEGFVRLVDVMGDDSSIVQAARISYGKGTKTYREDRGLIRFLMRNGHTSPFEQCEAKFHMELPMDVMRQLVRHRTANINEYSTRYSEAINSQHRTHPNEWRMQNPSNKQGSGEFLDRQEHGEALSQIESEFLQSAHDVYLDRINRGVAREQARKDLPLSNYTAIYWKMDLHNLFHFLALRMDSHAQKEIREYANTIGAIVKQWVPIAWEAFEDYRLYGTKFSKQELDYLRSIISGNFDIRDPAELKNEMGVSKREAREFLQKLDFEIEANRPKESK
jgi:thymidylate synthase (FAD)